MKDTMKFTSMLLVGAVLVVVAIGIIGLLFPQSEPNPFGGDQAQIRQFNSLQEIESFLKENADGSYNGYGMYNKAMAGDVIKLGITESGRLGKLSVGLQLKLAKPSCGK